VEDHRTEWQIRMGVGERQSSFHVHQGTTKREIVRREDDGKVGGFYTHRMDGSNDAHVFARTHDATGRGRTP
jgi:hypothetical protein